MSILIIAYTLSIKCLQITRRHLQTMAYFSFSTNRPLLLKEVTYFLQ